MCCHTKLSKTSFNTPIDTFPPRFRHQELADDISSLCVKRDTQRVLPLTYYSFLAPHYIFNLFVDSLSIKKPAEDASYAFFLVYFPVFVNDVA